jgi:hypothetical protein
MIEEIKLRIRTDGGSLVKVSATVEYRDGRIWFLKSPFAAKSEIKAMQGSKWHGYSDPPLKIWSVADCQRNRFQLGYLKGEDVYAWFDREVVRHEYTRPLMLHQKDLSDHFLAYHYGIMAAEMRCVSGESIVDGRIGTKSFKLPIAELFGRWATNHKKKFFVTGLKGFYVRRLRVVDIVSKGWKPVVKVTLKSGLTVRVTPEHEICVDDNCFKRADSLTTDDCVLAGEGNFVLSDPVVSVEPDGKTTVYDIRCEHPYHNFRANGVVVANCGKTLSVQEVMERSGLKDWWWIGPKTSLPNIRREFKIWNIDPSINITMYNYEALVRIIDEWEEGAPVPQGLICDESSRCKGATSQRSQAVQRLADMVRDTYGHDGYVIEMSGTPSPKKPTDWWAQAEIAWPGFLKEGSPKAMEERLAFLTLEQFDAGAFKKRTGWKDDERKCKHCGLYEDDEHEDHVYEPSVNEVAYLHERLKGLVIVKHLKDCVGLPEKTYRRVICKPNASTLRVGQALMQSAPNAITGLTWLRELSDGFLYHEVADGLTTCTHCNGRKTVEEWFDEDAEDGRTYQAVDMLDKELVARLQKREVACPRCNGKGEITKKVRETKSVPCPKDKALCDLLDECEETGRIVVFAGFTGSVDRIEKLCRREGWDVVRCDGRGWLVTKSNGTVVLDEEALDYWANLEDHARVAFVSHPESGGMSLTLRESRMVVFWSNSFKPEYRSQAEARIQTLGKDNPGLLIVDLIHLPTDDRVLTVVRENRQLELMTLGEVVKGIDWQDAGDGILIEEST